MHKFKVKSAEFANPTVLILTLVSEGGESVDFDPGQYAAISFKRFGRPTPMRCFSICSSPNDSQTIQFAIRVQGNFTKAVSKLKPGDRVNVQGPFGEFVIDEGFDKNIILMAGGIGVTPFLSMIRYASEVRLPIPITLLYSVKNQDDILFFNELLRLEKINPKFKVAFFITEGPTNKLSGARIVRGRITDSVLSQVTNDNFDGFTHFICGPGPFLVAMQEILIAKDVNSERIVTEAFNQGLVKEKSHNQTGPSKTVYMFAAGALAFGIVFITGLDLARAVPKIAKVEGLSNSQSNSTANTTYNSSTSNSQSPNTTNSTNSSSSGNSGYTSSPAYTQTPSYSSPVTAVS